MKFSDGSSVHIAVGVGVLVGTDLLAWFLHAINACAVVLLIVAPFLAGLVAGMNGPRPVRQAILGAGVGQALVLAVSSACEAEPLPYGRNSIPIFFWVFYAVMVAALAGRVQNRRIEKQPL